MTFAVRSEVTNSAVMTGSKRPVVIAGTHHGFADMLLVRHGLAQTPARRLASRMVSATAARNWDAAPLFSRYAALTFGLYPLRQQSRLDASLRGLARLAERGRA